MYESATQPSMLGSLVFKLDSSKIKNRRNMGTYFAQIKIMRFQKFSLLTIGMLVLASNVAAQQSSKVIEGRAVAIFVAPASQSTALSAKEIDEIREEARRISRAAVLAEQDVTLKALTKAQAEASAKIPFNRNLLPQ